MATYIGIDPGKSGGIAVINATARGVSVPALIRMPDTELDIYDAIRECAGNNVCAVIEWIHPAIQGIGKSQMSKLYGNYASLRMALTAAKIPFDVVQPRKWQQALGISPRTKNETATQWKKRLRAKAQQLFPTVSITLATSDALLMAEYARRFLGCAELPAACGRGLKHASTIDRRSTLDRSERRRL